MPARKLKTVSVNRAPVLTLWAAVVAERLGHDEAEALTLGKTLAGLNAQSKGRRLGIYAEPDDEAKKKDKKKPAAEKSVELLGRRIPVKRTKDGLRATAKGEPVDPESVRRYLKQKFGDDLDEVRAAMEALAKAYRPARLEAEAFTLYEKFRPKIPEGTKGWGAKGALSLKSIRELAKKKS